MAARIVLGWTSCVAPCLLCQVDARESLDRGPPPGAVSYSREARSGSAGVHEHRLPLGSSLGGVSRLRGYDLDMATHEGVAPHGGSAKVVGIEPIFAVADVPRSVDHYRRLGFRISYHDAGYAFAHRDRLTIHLAQTDDPLTAKTGSIYMHVDDAELLAESWRIAGVEVTGPEDFDWGKREGRHTDPDGNLIRFGSPLRRA